MNGILWSALVIGLTLNLVSDANAEDVTYRKHIKPLFDAKCAGCHGSNAGPEYYAFKEEQEIWLSKGVGMKLDSYNHLIFFTAWPDTGALMRRLDDGNGSSDGKPGNMYRNLGATDDERQQNLKLFRDWVGNWTLKRWKDITKEDIDGIKVKY
ncbi:MAG: cytochrome C [Candidatus Geothermincolia bacterium]